MNGQADGADIVVGAERINALTIDLSRVVIEMLAAYAGMMMPLVVTSIARVVGSPTAVLAGVTPPVNFTSPK